MALNVNVLAYSCLTLDLLGLKTGVAAIPPVIEAHGVEGSMC